MPSMRKNFIWNAFGNIVYLGLQWVITVFVTRFCGFDNAGVLSLAMSISATFQTIALFGIRSFQVSDIHEEYCDSCYLGLRHITCAVAAVICLGFSLINGYNFAQISAIILFMLFRIAESYSDVLHGMAQKRERLDIAGKSFLIKGLAVFIAFVLSWFITGSFMLSLTMMAAASCISVLAFDIPCIRRISDVKLSYPIKDCLVLGKETVVLCVYMFLNSSVSTIPKFFLEKLCDEVSLGIYSSIFAPALLVQAAAGYIYSPFATSFAAYYSEKKHHEFIRLMLRILAVIGAVTLSVLLFCMKFGDFFLCILFGETILEYTYLLPLIILCILAASYMAFLGMLEIIIRDIRSLICASLLGAAICTADSGICIKLFGINGTSIAMISGAVPASVIMLISIVVHICKKNDMEQSEST
ncbi:MAG: oligosaccharide flippase family protein [Oscillospiraceae bacterium]|nr:oligosaccharide flippase family protein [Oscillospiraceae bacterium]